MAGRWNSRGEWTEVWPECLQSPRRALKANLNSKPEPSDFINLQVPNQDFPWVTLPTAFASHPHGPLFSPLTFCLPLAPQRSATAWRSPMSSLYVQTTVMTRMPTMLPPLWITEGVAAAPRRSQTAVGVSRRPVCPSLYLMWRPGNPRELAEACLAWECAGSWLHGLLIGSSPLSAMTSLGGGSPLS